MGYLGVGKIHSDSKDSNMARATAAPAPAPEVKGAADVIGDALITLKGVDLRTIKDPALKVKVKDARTLLTEARKGLK